MRRSINAALLTALLVLSVPPAASLAAAPTPVPTRSAGSQPAATLAPKAAPATPTRPPAPTAAVPTATTAPTATAVAPTPTAVPPAAPVARAPAPAQSPPAAVPPTAAPTSSPVPTAAPTQPTAATPEAAPVAPAVPAPAAASSLVDGFVFGDADGDGLMGADDPRLEDVPVRLATPDGRQLQMRTDMAGAFSFPDLPAGDYRLSVKAPPGFSGAPDQEVAFTLDGQGSVPVEWGLQPDASPAESAAAPDGEGGQTLAMRAVTSLELRFAPGRDTLEQLARRTLADGSFWLGVPFRTQIDGTEYQFVNCGPASLAMVFAGFGLEVGAPQVREYLNALVDNWDTEIGTSLDVLSRIAREAGLTPLDLYSDRGGYRDWSIEAIRWHVEQGRPVIALMKYNSLPGHTSSLVNTEHYIVITGLTPDGVIYNDAAFSTTLGYGLQMTNEELEAAWSNVSIPHHAVAFGLPSDAQLSFPERQPPAPTSQPAPEPVSPSMPSLERDRARPGVGPLTDVPGDERAPVDLPLPSRPATASAAAAGLLPSTELPAFETGSGQEPAMEPLPLAAPRGEPAVEPGPVYEAAAGPRHMAPQLLLLLGSGWALALAWSLSGALVRALARLAPLQPARALASALLHVLRG